MSNKDEQTLSIETARKSTQTSRSIMLIYILRLRHTNVAIPYRTPNIQIKCIFYYNRYETLYYIFILLSVYVRSTSCLSYNLNLLTRNCILSFNRIFTNFIALLEATVA